MDEGRQIPAERLNLEILLSSGSQFVAALLPAHGIHQTISNLFAEGVEELDGFKDSKGEESRSLAHFPLLCVVEDRWVGLRRDQSLLAEMGGEAIAG
jgi:hypothetical protein